MPKGEVRLHVRAVVSAIADEQAFVVSQHPSIGIGHENRRVSLGARDAQRQAPTRLCGAAQHVRQRLAERLAREPGLDDTGHVLGPGHQHGHS